MKAPALSLREQQLQDTLLAQGHLSPQELNEILEQRQLAWEMALAPLSGQLAEISLTSNSLCLRSFPAETLLNSLPLERESRGVIHPGHWGRDVVCLNPEDGRLLHWYRLPEAWQPTLLLPSQGSTTLGSPLPEQPWLAACNQSLDTRLSTAPDFHPCDLTLSPETQQLLVVQRNAGTVQIVSLLTGKPIATVPIRPAGSAKALNLTLDSQAKKVYLCDQSSTQLHMLDLGSLQVRSLQTGLGVLGNLVLAPDPRYLYLLVLKPTLRLVYFDLKHFEVVQELSLKGQAFSLISDAPTDLMHLSPDQAHLAVLTSLDEPTPLTPVVNIIRTASVKTIRRFALKDGCRPAALATGLPNPLQTVAARSLSDWLGGKVPSALIREASSPEPPTATAATARAPLRGPQSSPPGETDLQERLNQPAPPISLPPEAEQALVEILVQAFYQEYLKQLRMHPAEIRRLRQTAHELRLELENHAAVMAEIKDILGHYTLKTLITRDALLQATAPLMKAAQRPFSPEQHCPICEALMENPEFCQHCGFRLHQPPPPEGSHIQPSREAFDSLLQGQLLLCLPESGDLLLLNSWHKALWQQAGSQGLFQEPVHAVALDKHRCLITDQQAGKLKEIDRQGQVLWESQIPLHRPVMATVFQLAEEEMLLVVDAQRVLVLDRQQQVRHSLGPETGLILKAPRDARITREGSCLICDQGRVQEVSLNGEVLQSWSQNLKNPVSARRTTHGELLVVDAGRQELLFFQGPQEQSHFSYWPPETGTPAMKRAAAPDRVLYTPTGELVLIGSRYWMQIQPELKKIRWSAPLPRGAATPALKSHAPVPVTPPPPEPSPRVELLRLVPFLAQAQSELLQILAEKLHPVHMPAGEWVLHAGEMGSALYFVAQGEVEVLNEETGQQLATLGAGDLFGEMALILSQPRSASVRTRSDCELLQLERSDFKQVVVKFPALARELRSLAQQRKILSHQAKRSRNQDMLNQLKARMAVAKLRELSFLSGAEKAFYDTLASVLRPVAFLPEQVVFHQGEVGYSLYFISRGAVGIFLEDNPQPAYELSAGEVFGEMALLRDQPRNATVRTLSYCQFYELERAAFAHVCQQFPAFSARIQRLVQERERMNLEHTPARQRPLPTADRGEPEGLPLQGELFYTSPLQELVLSLNQELEPQQAWGKELHLFQPFRLSWNQDSLLITDTGNDRILEINRQNHQLLREWGDHRLPLQQPRSAQKTEEGFYLIADEGNQRLIAVTAAGELVWEHTTPHEILSPSYAEFTGSETILFADAALHKVQEIDRTGEVLWSYGSLLIAGAEPGELCEPMCARRLPDGNTLIADSGNDRLLWVSPTGELLRVWQAPATGRFHQPVHCELLPGGQIWVCSGQSETGILLSAEGKLLKQQELSLPQAR